MYCGIICEFNPLTNGHIYLIKRAKEITGLPVLCLMSGNFSQRGEPTILDKYTRAKLALQAGADAVLELPTIYALSSAEKFASGAIRVLSALGCVSHIVFGSECGSLETLNSIADIKLNEPQELKERLKQYLDDGYSYNIAIQQALLEEYTIPSDFFDGANNILGLEYITAIKKQNSKITPLTIKRIDNGYNANYPLGKFASASYVRKLSNSSETIYQIENLVPPYVLPELITNPKIDSRSFSALVINKIRNSTPEELATHADYSEGIEYRIKEMCDKYSSLQIASASIETKRYRKSRINKLLLYPILGITKEAVSEIKQTTPAVKLLAIKSNKKHLISQMSQGVNLIIRKEDLDNLNKGQSQSINIDLAASNLYNLLIGLPHNADITTGTMFI